MNPEAFVPFVRAAAGRCDTAALRGRDARAVPGAHIFSLPQIARRLFSTLPEPRYCGSSLRLRKTVKQIT